MARIQGYWAQQEQQLEAQQQQQHVEDMDMYEGWGEDMVEGWGEEEEEQHLEEEEEEGEEEEEEGGEGDHTGEHAALAAQAAAAAAAELAELGEVTEGEHLAAEAYNEADVDALEELLRESAADGEAAPQERRLEDVAPELTGGCNFLKRLRL